jgi:hypothetical protein
VIPLCQKCCNLVSVQIEKACYSFSSSEWDGISKPAKDLISELLCLDASKRITVENAIKHRWMTEEYSKPNIPTFGVSRPSILGSGSSRSPAASSKPAGRGTKSPAKTPKSTKAEAVSTTKAAATTAGSGAKQNLKSVFGSPGDSLSCAAPKELRNVGSAAVSSVPDVPSSNTNSNLARIGSLVWSNSDASFTNRSKVSPKIVLTSVANSACLGGIDVIGDYVASADISYLSPPNSKFSNHGVGIAGASATAVTDVTVSSGATSLFAQATGLKSGLEKNVAPLAATIVDEGTVKPPSKRPYKRKSTVNGTNGVDIASKAAGKIATTAVDADNHVVEFVYDEEDIEEFSNDFVAVRPVAEDNVGKKHAGPGSNNSEKPPLPKSEFCKASIAPNRDKMVGGAAKPSPQTVADVLPGSNDKVTAAVAPSNANSRKRNYTAVAGTPTAGIADLFSRSNGSGKGCRPGADDKVSLGADPPLTPSEVSGGTHSKRRPGMRINRSPESDNSATNMDSDAQPASARPARKLRVPVKNVNVLFPPKQLQFTVKKKDPQF